MESDELQNWLAAKGLTIHQLLSISFVSRGTFKAMLSGRVTPLPAKHRLWKVTGLAQFELSPSELAIYEGIRAKEEKVEQAHVICEYLNNNWVNHSILPKDDDTLVFSAGRYQTVEDLAPKLYKKVIFLTQGGTEAEWDRRNNVGSIIDDWLTEKKITRYDLMSLAFVPRQTFDEIRQGLRRIPAIYRLWLITKLPILELNQQEEAQYKASFGNTKTTTAFDEQVVRHFLKGWEDKKALPDPKYRLITSVKKGQAKQVLSEVLKKLFAQNTSAETAKQPPSFDELIKELEATIYDDVRLKDFLSNKETREKLKKLHTLVTVLFEENPKAALLKVFPNSKKP